MRGTKYFPEINRRYPGVLYNRETHQYHFLALDWGDYTSEVAWRAARSCPG